jgi:hypothetical protein
VNTWPTLTRTLPLYARVYDCFVGGKDNFAADRDLAQRLIEALPALLPTTVENKDFLARAVTWAANRIHSQAQVSEASS